MEQMSITGHDTSVARNGRQRKDGETAWLSEMDVEDEVAQSPPNAFGVIQSIVFYALCFFLAEEMSLSAECPVN